MAGGSLDDLGHLRLGHASLPCDSRDHRDKRVDYFQHTTINNTGRAACEFVRMSVAKKKFHKYFILAAFCS